MTLLQAVVLGIVQGITEFFPISSSGHLVIFQSLFGLKEPQLAFDVFLHFGTLISIIVFFRKDIISLFGENRKTLLFIIIASVPTFIIGFFAKDAVEKFFGMPRIVGFMLCLTGVWLFAAYIYCKYSRKKERGLGVVNSIIVGIAQGIAVMPGISRSGATIATGMLSGLSKEEAFRFSFLLALPAVFGASVLKAHKITEGVMGEDAVLFLAGGMIAAITGFIAIKVLLRLIKADKFQLFGIYCVLAGILIIFR